MSSNQLNSVNFLDSTNATGVGSGGAITISGGIAVGRDTYIGGNLSISGTSATFADNMITLNTQPSGSFDTGLLLQRHEGDVTNNNNYSAIVYRELEDEFRFGYVTADARGRVELNSYIPIRTGGVSVTGGGLSATFDSNTIGSIITTGGNVGIGISNPSFTLDVSGSARFTTGITTGAVNAESAFVSGTISGRDLVLNEKMKTVAGSFNGLGSVNSLTNVTGMDFGNKYTNMFEANIKVSVGEVRERFKLTGVKHVSKWILFADSFGEMTGVTFDITNDGQIQYTNSEIVAASIVYYASGI